MVVITNGHDNIPSANGSSLYGNFRSRTFSDIYGEFETFKEDYINNGIPANTLSDTNLTTLYYLLYARYGNSCIASSDEHQFRYKLMSTIFMYGPAWQKKLEIQHALVGMDIDEAIKGTTAIYNQALNPSQAPSTQTLEELDYINAQNTTKYKKSKIEGYAALYALIATDVTEDFISRFKKLFITVVEPELPLWYNE
jgi:hypothetical protein